MNMRSLRNVLLAAAALCIAVPALADGIAIPMDEARVIAFDRPVQTVFVGNPMIADVNVIDARHAFILGKAFGVTNVIALDSRGNPIASRTVTVLGGGTLVTLNRGDQQYTYACANARCEHARAPGDVKEAYDANLSQIQTREDYGSKQADASSGQH